MMKLGASVSSPMTRSVVGATLLAAGLFYIRFGYSYGFSDQDEFIPLVMKWLDTSLFTQDWFVQEQINSLGIRTFFSGALYLLSKLMPLSWAVLVLHLLSWGGLTSALYSICYRLYHNHLTSFAFTIAATVITARWAPGSNDLFHSMLVPSSLGWALGLWSIDRLLAGRFFVSGLLISLSMLAHSLVGLQIGAVLFATLLCTDRKHIARFALPFLMVGIPLVLLFAGMGSTVGDGDSARSILTTLRAPHHYLPASFSSMSWIKWSLLAVTGGAVLWTDSAGTSVGRARGRVLAAGALSVAIVVVALILTTYVSKQSSLYFVILKSQPFNVAVLGKTLVLLGCAALVVRFLPKGIHDRWERWIVSRWFSYLMVAFFAVALVWGRPFYAGHSSNPSSVQVTDRLDLDLLTWIDLNTPLDAVFSIPPSVSGFQIGSRRAQYVNFKAFPFEALASIEWLRRLNTIAPVDSLEPGGLALLNRFETSYIGRTPSYWRTILEEENIDYIVRARHVHPRWSESIASHCSDYWCVYDAQRVLSYPNKFTK